MHLCMLTIAKIKEIKKKNHTTIYLKQFNDIGMVDLF